MYGMPAAAIAESRSNLAVCRLVQGDDVRPQTGYLSADQRKPVAPALMILFQVERHDSELHRPCPATPHDPAKRRTIPLSRRGVYRVWGAAFLLLGLYLVPVLVSF